MLIMYPIDNKEGKICEHGCGKIAKFKNASGKLCCCESFYQCPGYKKIQSKSTKNRPPPIPKGTRLKDKSNFCEICGKFHDGRYGSGRYCSLKCAHKATVLHTNQIECNKKRSLTLKNRSDFKIYEASLKAAITYNKNHPNHQIQLPKFGDLYDKKENNLYKSQSKINKPCKICGQTICPDHQKCFKLSRLKLDIFKNIIDISKIGSIDIYDEYDKLGRWLYDEYVNNKKSALDIQKELNIRNFVSVYFLLKKFNIPKRTMQQSIQCYKNQNGLKIFTLINTIVDIILHGKVKLFGTDHLMN